MHRHTDTLTHGHTHTFTSSLQGGKDKHQPALLGTGMGSQPLAHSLASQGGQGQPDTQTHRDNRDRKEQPLPPAPGCPSPAPLARGAHPQHNPVPVLKLLPLGGTPRPFPSCPVPSLSSCPGPGSHISHLILQLGIVRLSLALLLFVRRHVGVVGLCQALGTRAAEQVVLPEYLVAAVSAPFPLTAI